MAAYKTPEKRTTEEKTDCFAYERKGVCNALTTMRCVGCRFYKKKGTEHNTEKGGC